LIHLILLFQGRNSRDNPDSAAKDAFKEHERASQQSATSSSPDAHNRDVPLIDGHRKQGKPLAR